MLLLGDLLKLIGTGDEIGDLMQQLHLLKYYVLFSYRRLDIGYPVEMLLDPV